MSHNPELIKNIMLRIKEMASLKTPNYELPADMFIEKCAEDICRMVFCDLTTGAKIQPVPKDDFNKVNFLSTYISEVEKQKIDPLHKKINDLQGYVDHHFELQSKIVNAISEKCDAIRNIFTDLNNAHNHHIDSLIESGKSLVERIEKLEQESNNQRKQSDNLALQNQKLEEYCIKPCAHDWDINSILTSLPPQIKCKKCQETQVLGGITL